MKFMEQMFQNIFAVVIDTDVFIISRTGLNAGIFNNKYVHLWFSTHITSSYHPQAHPLIGQSRSADTRHGPISKVTEMNTSPRTH